MNDIRRYINILETASQDELQKYHDELKYWQNERGKYWPVSAELMAQYRDGTHTKKDSMGLYWLDQNDQLHRDGDLPAIIYADGGLEWFQNGQQHRFGGPARIYTDGKPEWWWRGEPIPAKSQDEFIEYLKKHKGLQRFRVIKP